MSRASDDPAPRRLGFARDCAERRRHRQRIRDVVRAPSLATFVRSSPHAIRGAGPGLFTAEGMMRGGGASGAVGATYQVAR